MVTGILNSDSIIQIKNNKLLQAVFEIINNNIF